MTVYDTQMDRIEHNGLYIVTATCLDTALYIYKQCQKHKTYFTYTVLIMQ